MSKFKTRPQGRPNTERPVTITEGTNELVSFETINDFIKKICEGKWKKGRIPELWDGRTAERIVYVIKTCGLFQMIH